MGGGAGVVVAPTTGHDVPEVAEFLHRTLNARISVSGWQRSIRPPWPVQGPNHGFHLRYHGTVVGAGLAFYSERMIGGRTERVCNLGAWCVDEDHRSQGVRLLRALLAQPGYHFTDLSPSGNVVALNERLRFQHLDTATAVVPNLPRPSFGVRLVTDLRQIGELLSGRDQQIFQDHRDAPAAWHLVFQADGRSLYIILRRDRRRGLPVFASVIYVSDPSLLRRVWGRLATHLLLRHGVLATLAELRVVGERPPWSLMLSRPRPKMFRSPALRADDIDYLYSELTCVAW